MPDRSSERADADYLRPKLMAELDVKSWTCLPNPILEQLMLKETGCPEQVRVLCCVIRHSYGYQRPYCCRLDGGKRVRMSPTDIARLLGMRKQNVNRTLKYWEDRDLIRRAVVESGTAVYLIPHPGSTAPNTPAGFDYDQNEDHYRTDYQPALGMRNSDYPPVSNSDDDLIRRKESSEKKAASSKRGFGMVAKTNPPVTEEKVISKQIEQERLLEVRTFLTATFISKFGMAAPDSVVKAVVAILGDTPFEQFQTAVKARRDDFDTYGLAKIIAKECANSKEEWSKASLDTTDDVDKAALDFERRFNERQKSSKSKPGLPIM